MAQMITTDRLVLRSFSAADGPAVVAALNTYEIAKWTQRVPHPFASGDLTIVGPDGGSRWPGLMAITYEDRVVGGISTDPDLGYWFAQPYWGQGLMTEAVWAVLDMLFSDPSRNAVIAGAFEANTASRRILDKSGFVETGRGKVYSKARGADVNHLFYRLERSAWEVR